MVHVLSIYRYGLNLAEGDPIHGQRQLHRISSLVVLTPHVFFHSVLRAVKERFTCGTDILQKPRMLILQVSQGIVLVRNMGFTL